MPMSSKSNNRARSLAFKSRRHRSGVGMASARGKPEDADWRTRRDAQTWNDRCRLRLSRGRRCRRATPARAGRARRRAASHDSQGARARASSPSVALTRPSRRRGAARARAVARALAPRRSGTPPPRRRARGGDEGRASRTTSRRSSGALSRAFFGTRMATGAFSRIAGPADDAGDAPARRPDADEDARGASSGAVTTRAREAPRVVDRPVENVAENVPERGGNVATASGRQAAAR